MSIWANAALYITASLILFLVVAKGYATGSRAGTSPFTLSTRPLGLR